MKDIETPFHESAPIAFTAEQEHALRELIGPAETLANARALIARAAEIVPPQGEFTGKRSPALWENSRRLRARAKHMRSLLDSLLQESAEYSRRLTVMAQANTPGAIVWLDLSVCVDGLRARYESWLLAAAFRLFLDEKGARPMRVMAVVPCVDRIRWGEPVSTGALCTQADEWRRVAAQYVKEIRRINECMKEAA